MQQQSILIPIITAIISVIAVILSLVALWKTHFSRFRHVSIVGSLRFRIYPMKSEGERWFIPSFDVPVSITNQGSQPGKILGLRIAVTYPDLPIPDNREFFYPKWEVDGKRVDRNRFRWIKKATVADWMPFVVLPKATVTKHFVFESKWDDPVIQNRVLCRMEVYTDIDESWAEIGKWELSLQLESWSALVNRGICWVISPDKSVIAFPQEKTYPKDLHKYTGTKEPIPNKVPDWEPTYLDYPENEKKIKRYLTEAAQTVVKVKLKGNLEEQASLAQELTEMEAMIREEKVPEISEFFAILKDLLEGKDIQGKMDLLKEPYNEIIKQAANQLKSKAVQLSDVRSDERST